MVGLECLPFRSCCRPAAAAAATQLQWLLQPGGGACCSPAAAPIAARRQWRLLQSQQLRPLAQLRSSTAETPALLRVAGHAQGRKCMLRCTVGKS